MTTLSLQVPRYAANSVSSVPVPAHTPRKNERKRALTPAQPSAGLLTRAFHWIQKSAVRSAAKRLQMIETVSLGEKRFVALVQVDERHFLIGGAPTNVNLLAEISKDQTVEHAISESPADQVETTAEPTFQAELLSASAIAADSVPSKAICVHTGEDNYLLMDELDTEELDDDLISDRIELSAAKGEPMQVLHHASSDSPEAFAALLAELEQNFAAVNLSTPVDDPGTETVVQGFAAHLASPLSYMQPAWHPELQGATS